MKINKDSLKEIKYISLGLENCEDFDIPTKYIVDINFEYGKSGDSFKTNDGFIEISSQALKILSSYGIDDYKNNRITDVIDYYLGTRFIGYCNLCVLSIAKNNDEILNVYVPYEPLNKCIHDDEIELTNCPSAEILDNGNLLVLFGKSSKMPTRIDNNYKDLILGWDNISEVKKENFDVIRCKIINFSNLDSDTCPRISVTFKSKKKQFTLIFEDYTKLLFDLYPKYNNYFNLKMSRMLDGKIHVGFDGCEVDFYCVAIKEYDYYCGEDFDSDSFDDLTYQKAIKLDVDENTMTLISHNHYALEEVLFDYDLIKKAMELYRTDDISINYLRCWLKYYSELLVYSRPSYNKLSKTVNKVATILDRIHIAISYDFAKNDILKIIEKHMEDIEKSMKI